MLIDKINLYNLVKFKLTHMILTYMWINSVDNVYKTVHMFYEFLNNNIFLWITSVNYSIFRKYDIILIYLEGD